MTIESTSRLQEGGQPVPSPTIWTHQDEGVTFAEKAIAQFGGAAFFWEMG
jgi:hypothetical protein